MNTKTKQKILIFGCGTIGGIIATRLSKVFDIFAYNINSKLVKKINKDGIKIIDRNNNINRAKFCISNKIEKIKNIDFDLVILTTKAYDTEMAAKTISKYLNFNKIISIQNGLNNAKIICKYMPYNSIYCGITTMAAQMLAYGQIKLFFPGIIYVSPYKSSLKSAVDIRNLFRKGGFITNIAKDYKQIIWPKLIFNSVMNPFTLITKSEYGIIKKCKEAQTLIKEAMAEGVSVTKGLGIKLYFNPYEIVRNIQYGKMNNFQYRGSMYYDIIKRKRTELDFITGEIINQANKLGIKVPTLKTIYQITKIIEKIS